MAYLASENPCFSHRTQRGRKDSGANTPTLVILGGLVDTALVGYRKTGQEAPVRAANESQTRFSECLPSKEFSQTE